MAKRMNFRERVDARRVEAKERDEERAKRGDAGQLKRLKDRGFGKCREAIRLAKG